MEQVRLLVKDEGVVGLVGQYLARFVSDGGGHADITQGISLGCPLSPLMGALYLKPLDDLMAPQTDDPDSGLFYARFMDDWVVLAPTRWKLRKAICAVNRVLEALKLKQHPDKTFIGRIARGFDFLGYFFSRQGLSIANKSIERMMDKVSRLYEQGADDLRTEKYVKRWCQWIRVSKVAKFKPANRYKTRCDDPFLAAALVWFSQFQYVSSLRSNTHSAVHLVTTPSAAAGHPFWTTNEMAVRKEHHAGSL